MTPDSWRKSPGEIESEIIMTRQLHRGSFLIVLAEYGNSDKIRRFEDTHGTTIRDSLVAALLRA